MLDVLMRRLLGDRGEDLLKEATTFTGKKQVDISRYSVFVNKS